MRIPLRNTENNNAQLAGKNRGGIDFVSRNHPQNHDAKETATPI
jgi:dihydroorotase-like cyclic amidohydrolase